MATRMEKYAKNANDTKSRSNRNKNLYNEIYTYDKYSNIEGIAEIENNNQVDITKVKELLKGHEDYQKQRKYRRFANSYKEPEEEKVSRRFPELEEKNYDIRDVLKEAKEKKEPDDKSRVLRNEEYNILKNIDLDRELNREDYYDESNKEDLKEMIETITNTSLMNKNKEFTSTDLLSDLKADDTKVGELNNVKEMIEQNQDISEPKDEKTNYDRSFFTSSLKLSKSDFVGGENQSGVFSKIIITLLLIIMIASAALLVWKMFF